MPHDDNVDANPNPEQVLAAKQERERKEARSRLQKPRNAEEQQLHKMRLEYKRMGIPVDF